MLADIKQKNYNATYYTSRILTGQYYKLLYSIECLYRKYGGNNYIQLNKAVKKFIAYNFSIDEDDPQVILNNSYNTRRILVDVLYLKKHLYMCF